MERIIDLGHDMARIWAQYYPAYMTGVRNTLILAFIATLAGGIIITFAKEILTLITG